MWGWFAKKRPSRRYSDDELRARLLQQVMSDLSKAGQFDPVYRDDVGSEAEFEVRMAELPLLVVWNEHDTAEGLAFSMSVNTDQVAAATRCYLVAQDPWFDETYRKVMSDLLTTAFKAMSSTVQRTGSPPSAICRSLAELRQS